MRSDARLLLLVFVLGGACISALAAPTPQHRITIAKFELRGDVDDLTKRRVVDRLTQAINSDHRAVVLNTADDASLLLPLSRIQQAPSLYEPSTIPETGKLLAPNYVLHGIIDREGPNVRVGLELQDMTTGFPVGTTSREWRAGSPIPELVGAVAELLAFIPRPSPLPPGLLTIKVTPANANIRFLNEAVVRPLPLEKLRLRPGRYAIAILPTDEAFEPMFEEINVRSGEHSTKSIALQRRKIEISLPQLQADAALFFDSQYVPPTERTRQTEAGMHEIAVVTADGSVQVAAVEVGLGRSTVPSLSPDVGALRQTAIEHLVHNTDLESPAVAGAADAHDIVIVSPQRVSLIDALTGAQRWSRDDTDGTKARAVLLDDVVVVTGSLLETVTTGGGHGGGSTTTVLKAEVFAYDRAARELRWRETFDHADFLDSDGSRALIIANSGLRLVTGTASPRVVELDARASRDALDLTTARFGGVGIVVANQAGTHVHSFSLTGQPAWALRVPDGVARIDARGPHLLVATNGKRLLKLSPLKGDMLWELSHNRRIQFLKFDTDDVLLFDGGPGVDRVALEDGSAASYTLPLGDLPIVTGCDITEQGWILLLIADHRMALVNPVSMRVEWHHDSLDRIVWFGTAKGIAAVATATGRLTVLGLTERHRIVGWIESIDAETRVARVRTLAPAIADEHLRALTLAEYRGKHGNGTPLNMRGIFPRKAGVIELPLPGSGTFEAGQLLVRGGGIRVTNVPEDAAIWIDQSLECHGDCVVSGLQSGVHEVLVTKAGFTPFRTTVDVGQELVEIRARLDQKTEDTLLEIDTSPRGAMVFIGERYAGDTREEPVVWRRLALGQVSSVRVEKFGYASETRELKMVDGRRTEHFALRQAPPFFEVMTGIASATLTPVVGWPVDAITSAGVIGQPIRRLDDSESRLFLRLSGGATIQRFGIEAGVEASGLKNRVGFGGVSYDVGRTRFTGRTVVGLRYLISSDGIRSSPPSIPAGQGTQEDRSAPLEQWEHPIPNVLIQNDGRSGLDLVITMRPQVHTFFRLSGGLVRGQAFRGTALVTDPKSGHLVRDDARSYHVEMKSGWHAAVEAQTSLSLLLPTLGLHPRYVLYGRYDVERSRFTIFTDDSQRLVAGVGVVFYPWWRW